MRDVVLQGDCLEVMAGLPDASVDAIITDPPYCAGAISEAQRTRALGHGLRSETIRRFGWFTGDNMGTAGLVWLLRSLACSALRVLTASGSLLVFCDWRMLSSAQPAIESAGLRYQGLIVWDKEHMGLGLGFRNQHELIMHFTAGAPAYHDRGTPNVLRCRRVPRHERAHQTQKPTGLLAQLVRVVSPVGGTVLDPMAGSGSLALACVAEQRHYILIEKEPAYVDLCRQRIAAAQPALPLTAALCDPRGVADEESVGP
jgi:site-specific DNA-methyltransferase (adenine-specific)